MATTPIVNPDPAQQLPPIPNQPQKTPEQIRLERLEADLDAQRRITADVIRQTRQPQTPPQQPDQRQQFFQDPVTTATAIARQAAQEQMQQFGAGHMETLIETCRQQVRASNPELFDRYSGEIEARVQQAGPQFQANINVWKSALNMVMGEHMREITDAIRQQTPQAPAVRVTRNDGPASPTPANPPSSEPTELTPEEKKMARQLGVDDDMYRAGKIYNDKQHSDLEPLGPSSWDKVITFDSRQKRRQERRNARAQRPAA